MKKYIKIQYVWGLVLTIVLSSCVEDLSNYDYIDLNEITFEGIDESYTALFGNQFSISPTLNFSISAEDESNYSYEWVAYDIEEGILASARKKDLATTKNLDIASLTIPPATYNVNYIITDNRSGVQWKKTFELMVETTIFTGWLALIDDDGKARLDMISFYNNEENIIKDVLGFANSTLKLEGEPIGLTTYSYDPEFYGIYITTTGNGTTKIEPETFDWNQTYNLAFETLLNVPTDFGADFIKPYGGSRSFMYDEGNFYLYYRVRGIRYGTAINIKNGEGVPFHAAPFVGLGASGSTGQTIFFDEDNKRFLRQANSTNLYLDFLAGNSSFSGFNSQNTGMDLVYMERSEFDGGCVFALMKKPEDGKYFLIRFRSRGSVGGRLDYFEEIPADIAADMDNADHFTIDQKYGYLLYNVGSKVYEFDTNLLTSKLMLDKGSAEITVLKFNRSLGTPDEYDDSLLICFSEGDNGSFEIYDVPPVNGDFIKLKAYSGLGKIKDIEFRER